MVIGWIIFSILIGCFTYQRGNGFFGGFLLSLIFSPLFGLLFALLWKKDEKVVESRLIESGEKKKCPYCAELIKTDAVKCRFCGSAV